jgi:hypothetical protein
MKAKKTTLFLCALMLLQNFIALSNTKNIAKNTVPEGMQVTLFKQDKTLGWISQGDLVYNENSFSLNLIENTNYIIKITKKGYASRTYCFSTTANNSKAISGIKFSFDMDFFKYKKEADGNLSDLVVSLTGTNSSTTNVEINKF